MSTKNWSIITHSGCRKNHIMFLNTDLALFSKSVIEDTASSVPSQSVALFAFRKENFYKKIM
jgi:hypothetical protein